LFFGTKNSGLKKIGFLNDILDLIENDLDVKLFIFGLKLIVIKPLLLQEAKTRDLLDSSKLSTLNPLSLEYDKITTFNPYSTRVSGALLSLIFFDKLENKDTVFLSNDTTDFLKELSKEAISLKKYGIEPNQIFMLMFSESINQSITSDSGSNYEDRILSVLKSIGINENKISKTHDENDSSTESTNSLTKIKSKQQAESVASRNAGNIDVQYVYDSSMALVQEVQNNETLQNSIRNPVINSDGSIQYIDQQTLDYMLNYVDYTDVISLNQVNNITSEIIKAKEIGYASYIDGMDISATAKSIVKDLLNEKRTYETPSEYPGFEELIQSEKDMLNNSYSLGEMARQNPNYSQSEVHWAAILAAGVVGFSIAGWPGFFIGAGIVAVISIITKL
jgi:hypothetical protein